MLFELYNTVHQLHVCKVFRRGKPLGNEWGSLLFDYFANLKSQIWKLFCLVILQSGNMREIFICKL